MSRDDITSGDLLFHTTEGFDLSLLFLRLSSKYNQQQQLSTSSSKKTLAGSESATSLGNVLGRYYVDLFNLEYSNTAYLTQTQEQKIQQQITLRFRLRHYFEQKLQYLSRKLIKTINYRKNLYLLTICRESMHLKERLRTNHQTYDTIAFQSMIQYYSILQTELANAKERLLHDRYEKEILKKQSLLLRNLLVFNLYLRVETKQCIELQLLGKSSAQFQRCMKAVFDNLGGQNHLTIYHPDVVAGSVNTATDLDTPPASVKSKKTGKLSSSSSTSEEGKNLIYTTLTEKNMKVLNIFKLKNTFLANNLQKIASKIPNSKMKGLFCCFPSDYLYNFTVYGLKEQQLFSSPAAAASYAASSKHHNYHRANLAQYIDPSLLHSMSPNEIFQAYWLFAQQPEPLRPLAPDYLTLYQQSYRYAEGMARLEAPPSSPHAALPKQRFRFSKYSMISSMNEYSSEQLENGVFLALCRVLIVKQKTVQTIISDADIVEAMEQGYDAIFSAKNDEYCLLQEPFVLPEFLIHLSFPTLISSRINELTVHQQAKDTKIQYEDSWYQHLFSPNLHQLQQQQQQLLLHQRQQQKKRGGETNQRGRLETFMKTVDEEEEAKTVPDVMSDNYFEFVEKLQNDQYKDGSSSIFGVDGLVGSGPATKGGGGGTDFSNQKNIMIKQNALLSIENSVKECQKSNQQLIASASRRMVQLLSQLPTVNEQGDEGMNAQSERIDEEDD